MQLSIVQIAKKPSARGGTKMPRKQTELRRVMEMHKITANEVSQMIYRRVSTVVTWMHHQETEIPKELLELLKYKLKYEPIK